MRNLIILLFGLSIVLTTVACSKEEGFTLLEQKEVLLANYQYKDSTEVFWEIIQNTDDVEMRDYLKFVITDNDTIMLQSFCYEDKPYRFDRLFEKKQIIKSTDIMVSENDRVVVIDLKAYRDDNCPRGEMYAEKYIRQTIILEK
ncbi:MAG: hypothetical protein KBD52_02240 [Candidatus Pacebacteria bacterium]|nr:hypothetical protein [Candidatus Paceibacterota bacterium]